MRVSNTANRIKEIMATENLRQVDILEKAKPFCSKYDTKITKVDLSQYVSGKVEPGQAKLFVLANALHVNEAWLMGYDVPKPRYSVIVSNHLGISDNILYAIKELAEESGYHISIHAKQYQITVNDCVVKLSPKEVEDLTYSSVEQIRFVVKNIIDNKLRDNITPIRQDLVLEADAAHEDKDATPEERILGNFIMTDDSEWE